MRTKFGRVVSRGRKEIREEEQQPEDRRSGRIKEEEEEEEEEETAGKLLSCGRIKGHYGARTF